MPETDAATKLTRAEAARRNGARSGGPRTPEGKARSARNALKHGLTAQAFTLLPGEDAQAYAQLLRGLVRRYRPADELAAHLVQRLASVMWRQQRADRLEAEVLTQLEQRPDSSYLGGYVPSSPRTWDAARFSAVQRQQARLDRAFFRLLAELDRLIPADAEEGCANEPEGGDGQKLPKEAGQASTDGPANDGAEALNEPDRAPPAAVLVATPAAAQPARDTALRVSLAERDAAGRLLAEGRVEPANDFLRAMLARAGDG